MTTNQFPSSAHTALGITIAAAVEQVSKEPGFDCAQWLQAAQEMFDHGNRCANLMAVLAQAYAERVPNLEFNANLLAFGAYFHDVGKLRVPAHLLLAPRDLTEGEYRIVQAHVQHGRRIVEAALSLLPESSQTLACLHQMVACHHEHWDGSGYPNALAGDSIPIPARLMAIVDVYDAIRSRRPYKPAMGHEEACAAIREGSGTAFDPEITKLFAALAGNLRSAIPELP